MPKLTPLETRAWRGLLQTHQRLWTTLDRELQDETGLNLAAYELLLKLEEGPDTGLRMTELAHALGYSLGGLTRLADKLQALNLITRERCETDGRGYQVTLTPHGAQRLKRLHVTHLNRVRALFLNRVTPEEQQVLASIWTRLQEEPA
ncbi:MarR family winged helix-turn-helix transcriptional regulator [Deinococcus ficus]|uniref:MarR family winged helix-turn-helix transcriptional regulator n=1 Tax=Deinococcus ficus TaxID=317577 RepID=UPI00174B0041|nr:MarR family transcriptional regulator [Deinococcus ficus]GHF70304.1 MarR family transcriptional regulator [Deinococcus ficus]